MLANRLRATGEAMLVQGGQYPAHGVVRLHHEIAIAAGLGLSDEFLCGDDRRVRRREGEVEKERLVFALPADPLLRFFL